MTMLQVIKDMLSVPKEIRKLCEDIDLGTKTTVESVRKNGVILDKLKPNLDRSSKI